MNQLLDKAAYSDSTIFVEEQQRIFFSTWQLAGHVSQLRNSGDFVTLEIAGQSVFVIRAKDGALRAFYNVCQHRAHELLEGSGNVRGSIVCPYHAWTFTDDGRLQSARNCMGKPGFDAKCFSLHQVRVESALGFVFVNLDDDAIALEQYAPGMFEDIRRHVPWWDQVEVSDGFETAGPDLDANWKVLAENCLECYHCGPAHPAFCDFVRMQSYRCSVHSNWLRSYGELAKPKNMAYSVDPNEPCQHAIYWHLWPNTELIIYPGNAAMTTFRFAPRDAATTQTSSLMLLQPGDTVASDRLDYRWNVLWPEDESLCTSVHRGLQSKGYGGGHLVLNEDDHAVSEHGVLAFQENWRRWMARPESSG